MNSKIRKHKSNTGYCIAGIFIAVGLLLLGRNLNIITPEVYRMIVSWQVLLVVIGLNFLSNRKYIPSLVLIAVGAYFFVVRNGLLSGNLSAFIWPFVLIAVGVFFIVNMNRKGDNKWKNHHRQVDVTEYKSEDGYFSIDNNFGGVHQVIMDEVIRGGDVKSSFGGVVLDLRRTSLPVGTTYIDVNVSFGGIEFYIPSTWSVKSEIRPFMGAFDDTRFSTSVVVDTDRVLIFRGTISVGGVEIKG